MRPTDASYCVYIDRRAVLTILAILSVNTVAAIYEALGLPAFSDAEGNIRSYVKSLSDYRENKFPELPQAWKQRISQSWGRFFEHWGYST